MQAIGTVYTEIRPKDNYFTVGCFFHFTKAVWDMAAKLGLKIKDLIHSTKLMILLFKSYLFLGK